MYSRNRSDPSIGNSLVDHEHPRPVRKNAVGGVVNRRRVFLHPAMKRRGPSHSDNDSAKTKTQETSSSLSLLARGRPRHGNSKCPTLPPYQPLPRTPPAKIPSPVVVRPPPQHQHHDHHPHHHILYPPPVVHRVTSSSLPPCLRYERIGDPALGIFKLRLPRNLIGRLDGIIARSEEYAEGLQQGWRTELYSLTRQDLALRDIPGMTPRIRPILEYITQAIQFLYGCRRVAVDKNQPHILKYSIDTGHTGVQLHHDRCDVTANLVMSQSDEYEGGGTYFPDAGGRVVRLEQGEFLLHPGSLVHGGMPIQKGTRFLMVLFAHLKNR